MRNDFKYGDRVKASNDTICWWYGTYIGKHPKNDTHIVLADANSNFRQAEKVDTYSYILSYKETKTPAINITI